MKNEQMSIKQLKAKCWELCRKYNVAKEPCCFTCGSINEPQAGHFIHGHTKATFFEPDNIHRQCKRCNLFLSGNLRIYTLKMIDKYGREFVDKLDRTSKMEHVHSRQEVIIWIAFYKDKLKQL